MPPKAIKCECEGLSIFKEMVDWTIDAAWGTPGDEYVKMMSQGTAQKLYDHLLSQANKPGNKALRGEAMKRLDISRSRMAQYRSEKAGTMVLDELRDALHKTPALRQLLFCKPNVPGADIISEICTTLFKAEDNPKAEIYSKINNLSSKLGC